MTKKRRVIIAAAAAVIIAGAYTSLRIFTCPVWRDAQLTVQQAVNYPEIPCVDPDGSTLETRILPPEGFTRTPSPEGSFAEYIRSYPMLPNGSDMPIFDGSTRKGILSAGVFDISLPTTGYQQCADSIIRLYSDYFRQSGQEDRLSYHFTNGCLCDWASWQKGTRILACGSFSCRLPMTFHDSSEQQYRNYLLEVMRYAGTLSMQKESEPITAGELRIGDIICNDEHVVLIADEAVSETGERCFLIGQGFIPSVCFHIVNGTGDDGSPWYTEEELSGETMKISGRTFRREDIMRWMGGPDKK